MEKILFVIGKTFSNYSIKLAQNLKLNSYDSYFLTNNYTIKTKIEKNGWKNKVFFPNFYAKRESLKNNLNISTQEIDDIMYFTLKKSEILGKKIKLKDDFYNNCYKFINYVDNIIDNFSIKVVIMWNYKSFYNNIIKLICERKNIEHIFFEAGLFRPNTLAFDTKGLNYENSVPREKAFYEEKYMICSKKINIKTKAISLKKLTMYEEIKSQGIKLFINNFMPYGKFINLRASKRSKLRISFTKKNQIINLGNKKIIFIPFQVRVDTQIICFSPRIKNMFELVNFVTNAFTTAQKKGYFEDYILVFKEHPKDKSIEYSGLYKKYKDRNDVVFLKNGSTQNLIKNSEFIITINSTVGLEAIELGKRVLVLGEAFFSIDGITKTNRNIENLSLDMINMLDFKIEKHIRDNFLYYLKEVYSVKKKKNEIEDFSSPIEKIIKILDNRG